MASLNGETEDPAYILKHLDEIGGPKAYNHYPGGLGVGDEHAVPMGQAGGLALRRHAQPAGHLVAGRGSRTRAALRTQFHHVIDIAPTHPGGGGHPQPAEVNGVPQKPIEGVSMVYSFDEAKAKGIAETQYFEMFGNRAIYHDGWIAVCRHGRLPWRTGLRRLRQRHLGALQRRRRFQRSTSTSPRRIRTS